MINNIKHIKVAVIGDSGVGKTSIIKSYFGENIESISSTIAIDNYVITKDDVKVILWDFAGQRWFTDILVNFIKGSNLVLLVFDLSDFSSLKNIMSYWIPQIEKYKDENTVILLVGNKKDKKTIGDEILIKILDKVKAKLDYHLFIQTSALLGENIHKLFDIIFDIVKSFTAVRGLRVGSI